MTPYEDCQAAIIHTKRYHPPLPNELAIRQDLLRSLVEHLRQDITARRLLPLLSREDQAQELAAGFRKRL